MTNKIPHTIRFDPEDKEKLQSLAELRGHGFQTEVDLAIKQYLKDREVLLFCESVRCWLDSLNPHLQSIAVAKIANIMRDQEK